MDDCTLDSSQDLTLNAEADPIAASPDRRDQLLAGIDKSMRGIEISPFYNPVAPKAEGWKTLVVSNADASAQRRLAMHSSAESLRQAVSSIEDVDLLWTGNNLAELVLEREPTGVDYAIASHVIEHIPDFVGFLRDLQAALKPEGIISLAVPDCRLEFDFFRPLSDTADVLTAFHEKRRRNTPATLFRSRGVLGELNGYGAWTRSAQGVPELAGDLATGYAAMLQAMLAQDDKDAPYQDAHAWVFVPASFKLIVYELRVLRLIDLEITRIEINEGSEFIVQLKRAPIPSFNADEVLRTRSRLAREIILELNGRPHGF